MSMNVLLIYSFSKGTTAFYLEKALKQICSNVCVFDPNKSPGIKGNLYRYNPDLFNISIKDAISMSGIKPDLIIEIDCDPPCHLKGLRDINIPTVYWAIDSHRKGKRKHHLEICRDFDLFLVAQKEYVPLFYDAGANASWMPLACDPEIHRSLPQAKSYDVSFIGSLDPKRHFQRVMLLDRIKENFNLYAASSVYYEDMAKAYSSAKIGFNKSIGNDINMRVFEVMSCGPLLLTDHIEDNGMEDLFVDRKHLVIYRENDLIDLVRYYLSHEGERASIAAAGQNEVRSKHTYEHRAKAIISAFNGARL